MWFGVKVLNSDFKAFRAKKILFKRAGLGFLLNSFHTSIRTAVKCHLRGKGGQKSAKKESSIILMAPFYLVSELYSLPITNLISINYDDN